MGLRDRLQGGIEKQKDEGGALPDVNQQQHAESGTHIGEPVEHRQVQSLHHLVDNAIVGGEHHPPAQGHRYRGKQVGQKQQGSHGLLAAGQAVDQKSDTKTNEHLKNDRQEGKFHSVQNRLPEIGVVEELCIVSQGDKRSGLLEVSQEVIVCKTIEEGEQQGIGCHDQQDQHGGADHPQAETPGGALGGAGF